jgi:hypothetical protein
MSKTITVQISTPPAELMKEARSLAYSNSGVELFGDASSGSFSVKGLEGEYKMKVVPGGTLLTITISRKPFFLPWRLIENFVRRAAESNKIDAEPQL